MPHFRDDDHETEAATMKKPKKIERIVDDSLMKTSKEKVLFSQGFIFIVSNGVVMYAGFYRNINK